MEIIFNKRTIKSDYFSEARTPGWHVIQVSFIKGTRTRDFLLLVFSYLIFPSLPDCWVTAILNFVGNARMINCIFTIVIDIGNVIDTDHELMTKVVFIDRKLTSVVVDTGGKWPAVLTPVSLTAAINLPLVSLSPVIN